MSINDQGTIVKFCGSDLFSFLRQGQSVENSFKKSGFLRYGELNKYSLDKLTISICQTHTDALIPINFML